MNFFINFILKGDNMKNKKIISEEFNERKNLY